MLDTIDTEMIDDLKLTPEQWKKVLHFVSHNIGNALNGPLLMCEMGAAFDPRELAEAASSARTRYREVIGILRARADGETEEGEKT